MLTHPWFQLYGRQNPLVLFNKTKLLSNRLSADLSNCYAVPICIHKRSLVTPDATVMTQRPVTRVVLQPPPRCSTLCSLVLTLNSRIACLHSVCSFLNCGLVWQTDPTCPGWLSILYIGCIAR
jgi:hypothetical protein